MLGRYGRQDGGRGEKETEEREGTRASGLARGWMQREDEAGGEDFLGARVGEEGIMGGWMRGWEDVWWIAKKESRGKRVRDGGTNEGTEGGRESGKAGGRGSGREKNSQGDGKAGK